MLTCLLLIGGAAVDAQDDDISATIYQTVNVRSGPGATYEIVAQVSEGATVTVNGREGDGSDWLRVTLADGKTGWVPAYVLILQADPTELPIVGGEPPTTDANANVSVKAFGRVNVRSGPSITFPIVSQLDVNDTAQVKARSNPGNDWLYIENDALSGWIAYFTVTVTGNAASLPIRVPDSSGQVLVPPSVLIKTRFNTRLHVEPVLESNIVSIIPFDREVTPLAKSTDGGWLYVAFEKSTGWAFTALFVISDEQLTTVPLYVAGVVYVVGDEGAIAIAPTAEATSDLLLTPEVTATAAATPT